MSASAPGSAIGKKIDWVAQMVRTKGLAAAGRVLFSRLNLHVQIRLRGRNRTVALNGCKFPLRDVPDTEMKLQLLLGTYEGPERSAASRYIDPEASVVELGGCIGVVSCITNKLLNQPTRHIVLEANPFVVPLLEANRAANGCSFTIVNRALAYDSTTVSLMPSPDFWGTSLHDPGNSRARVDVPVTQLRALVEGAQFDRFVLICDIEGQEYVLVKNELDVLRQAEVVIMELHPHILGEEKVTEILDRLGTVGFEVRERTGAVVVLRKS